MRSALACLVALVPAITHAQPAPDRDGSVWTDLELGFGAGLAGLGYAGSIAWARQSTGDQGALWIPVLGPWLELSTLPDCGNGEMSCPHNATRSVLIVSGLAQLAGVGLMAHALTKPHHKKPPVVIAPTMTETGGGVQIRGRF